jgi:replicative superfamily II helicase
LLPDIFLAARHLYHLSREGFVHERTGLSNFDILVSTPEWLDKILRTEPKLLKNTTLLVFDEIHILRDYRRGAVSDKVFAWLRSICEGELQTLVMSATISNSDHVGKWLKSDVIKVNERPVKLAKGVMSLENRMAKWDRNEHSELPETSMFNLSNEEIWNRKSLCFKLLGKLTQSKNEAGYENQVLVFLNTRNKVYVWAGSYAYLLKKKNPKIENRVIADDIEHFNEEMKEAGRPLIRKNFSLSLSSLGIGIHTARMTFEEREFMEQMFLRGVINVMFCTSTLSMGINLPARIVLVPFINIPPRQRMTKILASQMLGRAGRLGFGDKIGYGLILTKNEFEAKQAYFDYIESETEPISSSFIRDGDSIDIFDTQVLSLLKSKRQLPHVLNNTLANFEAKDLQSRVFESLSHLWKTGFIEKNANALTKLGVATIDSMIDVETAISLYNCYQVCSKKALEDLYDSIIDKICGIPEGKCVFGDARLDKYSYSELLKMRIKESLGKNDLLKYARLRRLDIGQRDIDFTLKEALRHLNFLKMATGDKRVSDMWEGLRLGINPSLFWLLDAFDYREVRRTRRLVKKLDSAGLPLGKGANLAKNYSKKTLKYFGLSNKEANIVHKKAKQKSASSKNNS